MPIMFNTLLTEAGLALNAAALLRHQDNRAELGKTPYELWRDDPAAFELYQSHQRIEARARFQRPYWAVFVGTPDNQTLFVGVYAAKYRGVLDRDTPQPHRNEVDRAGSCDVYDLSRQQALSDLIGRLYIDWGEGFRAWVQHADKQNKAIRELRTVFQEPNFPGFLNFVEPLSKLPMIPKSWTTALSAAKGVYLLTCPRTKEQYVGSATGTAGFWERWLEYVRTGHGGNVELKSRDPSDYQVSILAARA